VSELPTIDPEAIANLRDLNPGDGGEFLREIVGIYVEDTPKRIAEMRASIASANTPALTRAAHTIKGSSANVGAQLVKAVAERIEALSRKEGVGGAAPMVDDCEREFERARVELQRLSA
jgi:HPt (histidine-containing phosphotransfer) domain-containing protein